MPDASPLLLIQLTPPGRGAVATLRIDGDGALDVVGRHFVTRSGRPLAGFPLGRIVVGQFGPSGEEVVVNRHSDSVIELHCHGGLAAVARIEEILISGACRRVSWQEWAKNQEADPIAAAARLALAEARTTPAAAILLDQYRGALRRAMEQIESSLQAGAKQAARRQIETLLAHAATGLHLVRPWQVVVAGRPNVGKSSLVNAVAGYQRAIVHSTPGTTRDIVSVQTAMDGWPVEVSDTAGLRETDEKTEQVGIDLARRKILAADLTVLVFDSSLPWSGQDQALVESYPMALQVHNKSDLPCAPGPPACGSRPPGLELSAMHSTGIDVLCHEIAGRLVPSPPPAGAAVPFEPEQIEQIRGYFERI
jgi:tRNA modification GTPase